MCIHTLSVTVNMQFQQKETGTYEGTLSTGPLFALLSWRTQLNLKVQQQI